MKTAQAELSAIPGIARLKFSSKLGVCNISFDTYELTSEAIKLQPKHMLDMGTGSGYTAICLAQLGTEAEGADISPRAIALANENAQLNNLPVHFFCSDHFQAVTGHYDLITYNPPIAGNCTELTRIFGDILRRFQSISQLIIRISNNLSRNNRVDMLTEWLIKGTQHLTPDGNILLIASDIEVKVLRGSFPKLNFISRRELSRQPNYFIWQIKIISD